MSLKFGLLALGSLLLLVFGLLPSQADCLSQCESQHQTCLRGCTSSNAKQCVDSCFRGSSACRSRCRSEIPVQSPDTRAVSSYRPIFAALSSNTSCPRVRETRILEGLASACPANSSAASGGTITAAVTCRSNEWCCRHEDFSKGTCAKCCPK